MAQGERLGAPQEEIIVSQDPVAEILEQGGQLIYSEDSMKAVQGDHYTTKQTNEPVDAFNAHLVPTEMHLPDFSSGKEISRQLAAQGYSLIRTVAIDDMEDVLQNGLTPNEWERDHEDILRVTIGVRPLPNRAICIIKPDKVAKYLRSFEPQMIQMRAKPKFNGGLFLSAGTVIPPEDFILVLPSELATMENPKQNEFHYSPSEEQRLARKQEAIDREKAYEEMEVSANDNGAVAEKAQETKAKVKKVTGFEPNETEAFINEYGNRLLFDEDMKSRLSTSYGEMISRLLTERHDRQLSNQEKLDLTRKLIVEALLETGYPVLMAISQAELDKLQQGGYTFKDLPPMAIGKLPESDADNAIYVKVSGIDTDQLMPVFEGDVFSGSLTVKSLQSIPNMRLELVANQKELADVTEDQPQHEIGKMDGVYFEEA